MNHAASADRPLLPHSKLLQPAGTAPLPMIVGMLRSPAAPGALVCVWVV